MNDERKEIGAYDLLKTLWRAFLIQASWSFDHMQTLGFAFAMKPVLKKLYPDIREFRSMIALHMEYFNTQPYLASFVLGAAARLEQEKAFGRDKSADAAGVKGMLMAPLGAIGDSYFWGSLKPLTSLIASALALTGAWWAPLLFLLMYNFWHLRIRTGALFIGFNTMGDTAALINRYGLTRNAGAYKAISVVMLGAIIGTSHLWKDELVLTGRLTDYGAAAACLLITLIMGAALRRGASPIKLMIGLAALSIALAHLGAV